jgi:diaminohydroxyphosphoribosylaminopyrimidine deaminase/5-amino-6-(5-phosphoribosylamino)uracil reductase
VSGAGFARLRAHRIEVNSGLLEREARALNPGFFSRFEKGRPFVRLKIAMSLDGRTALHNGQSQWITGEAARTDVQRYRARSSAILTGAGTVRADDPQLNVRLNYGAWVRQPRRVVLDGRLSLAPDARVFAGGDSWVFTAENAPERPGFPATVTRVPKSDGELDLSAILDELATREINEVLVECGARLAASFLRQGLVDEWILYVAPVLFGSDGRALIALQGLSDIPAAPRFSFKDVRLVGEDLRVILQPKQA